MEKKYLVIAGDEENSLDCKRKIVTEFDDVIIFLKNFIESVQTDSDYFEEESKKELFEFFDNCSNLKELDDYPTLEDDLVGGYCGLNDQDDGKEYGMFSFHALDVIKTIRIIEI